MALTDQDTLRRLSVSGSAYAIDLLDWRISARPDRAPPGIMDERLLGLLECRTGHYRPTHAAQSHP
jgi:hypothetical protein